MPVTKTESCDAPVMDSQWMSHALTLAREAADRGEVPVGAVVVWHTQVIGVGANDVEHRGDALCHAEIIALGQAQRTLGDWRLNECTLYVTKEPCAMCAGAMVNCRLGRLVYGASDARMGCAGGALDITGFPGMLHRVEVTGGVLADECTAVLKEFFRRRRQGAPKCMDKGKTVE